MPDRPAPSAARDARAVFVAHPPMPRHRARAAGRTLTLTALEWGILHRIVLGRPARAATPLTRASLRRLRALGLVLPGPRATPAGAALDAALSRAEAPPPLPWLDRDMQSFPTMQAHCEAIFVGMGGAWREWERRVSVRPAAARGPTGWPVPS